MKIKLLQTSKLTLHILSKNSYQILCFLQVWLAFFSFEKVFNFKEIYFHTFIFIGHVSVSYPNYCSLHQVPKVFFHTHIQMFYSFRSQILFYGPFESLLCYKGQNTFCCYYVKRLSFSPPELLVTCLTLVNRRQSVYFQISIYAYLDTNITSW